MRRIFSIVIWLLALSAFSQDETINHRFLISTNIGTAIVLRPQLSLEYRFNYWNSVELTGGYIAQNKSLQEASVKYLHEDAFLSSGFFTGLSYKRMSSINPNGYFGVQAYYKHHSYSNEVWHNGYTYSESDSISYAMSYVKSNVKNQYGLYFFAGVLKELGDRFFVTWFGGAGFLYYQYHETYHERIYDNSLEYKYKEPGNAQYVSIDTPFSERNSKLYPILHGGIKIGLGFGNAN